MKDTDLMMFGKHKGKMLGEIPADYMLWLHKEMKDKKGKFAKELSQYLEENYEYYQQQISSIEGFSKTQKIQKEK